MKFNSFALKKSVLNALEKLGYEKLTPVQEAVIPSALKRESLVVQSETGSGKTHSFLVPIINNVDTKRNDVQSIILAPTRELAKQTYDFAIQLGNYIPNLRIKLLTSGTDRQKQEKSVKNSAHIFIGTPGRIKDFLIDEHLIGISAKTIIVIDEADMMMEMGYFDDINAIVSSIKNPQIMVFSATYPQKLRSSIEKYVEAEKIITISKKINTAKNVINYALDYKHQNEFDVIRKFILLKNPYLLLIFCSKKTDVNKLHSYLNNHGIKSGIIHGDLEDHERKTMMRRIKNGEFNVVVCSDIAARGIDIQDVSMVVNYDLPRESEYFFHRVGRTGRINKKGESYTLYNIDSLDEIKKLQSLGVNFKWLTFKNDVIEEVNGPDYRKNHRKSKTAIELENEIKKATSKVRTSKVKPNYKKKIKLVKEKVVRKHHREMIKKDIRRQQVERYREGAKNDK
jgi:ATP-dependent RNA helicase CshB